MNEFEILENLCQPFKNQLTTPSFDFLLERLKIGCEQINEQHTKDLQEFAEWCMVELRFYDGCYIRGKIAYESIEDCRDVWEIETGRRSPKQKPTRNEYLKQVEEAKKNIVDMTSGYDLSKTGRRPKP